MTSSSRSGGSGSLCSALAASARPREVPHDGSDPRRVQADGPSGEGVLPPVLLKDLDLKVKETLDLSGDKAAYAEWFESTSGDKIGDYVDKFRRLPIVSELVARAWGSHQAKVVLGSMKIRQELAVSALVSRRRTAFALLLVLFRLVSAPSLVWRVARRRPMRVARVLTQLLRELPQPLLELRDARVLLRDARVSSRELRFELCDPVVSPIALHDPPMIELRPDGKPLRIYGAK
jgi:hypothetical protein